MTDGAYMAVFACFMGGLTLVGLNFIRVQKKKASK